MPGLLHITLAALLASCDAFRLGSSQRVIPLNAPLTHLFRDEGPAKPGFIQELVRTKRHSVQELVRAQPHLVHDMGWPEIHETSRSQAKPESANSSQLSAGQAARARAAVDDNLDVEDEMERMVHLAVPQAAEGYTVNPDFSDPETELLSGPGAGDSSQEASGLYGTDMEDRERGEEGAEDRERRGGEDEWEKEEGEESERKGEAEEEKGGVRDDQDVLDALEVNHTTPDFDALIGYNPSFNPSSSKQRSISIPAQARDSGPQEHRVSPVLEVGPLERELWEAEGEEDVLSSGYGVLRSSVTTTSATSSAAAAAGDAVGTATPETDTGTDFGLLGSYTKGDTEDEEAEREEEEEEEIGLVHVGVFTHNPTVPEVGLAPSREPLQPSAEKGFRPRDRSEEVEEEKWKKMEREETRIRHIIPLTTDPSPTIGFTDPSWDWLEKTTPLQSHRSEVRGGGVTEVLLLDSDLSGVEVTHQVVCVDWSELTGRGYVVLNMTQNINCEDFRLDQGVRLLTTIERVFARRMNSPEGTWVIYLSKPTHQQHQLLMNVASVHGRVRVHGFQHSCCFQIWKSGSDDFTVDRNLCETGLSFRSKVICGVIPTKDMLGMLAEIKTCLTEVGIQNYSAASNCPSRPSQTRSDYGKLFVVLVIIGSICMVIITSGFIYICWQRRLPATKTAFRAEELHFVVNGCHDNPTLDVTNDGQPEMQEKKPSTNGLAGVGGGGGGRGDGGGEDSSRWQVFVNQAATEEEEEEQDTHL